MYFRGLKELREFALQKGVSFDARAKAPQLRDILIDHFKAINAALEPIENQEEPRENQEEAPRNEEPNLALTLISPEIIQEMQRLEEAWYQLIQCRDNLVEYRSHLVRHAAEDEAAAKQMEELPDDEAVSTSDYKMKVLSCFFRETQKKLVGKQGTTVRGFMIARNPVDAEDKAKGIKD